jgi:hypothetical protein
VFSGRALAVVLVADDDPLDAGIAVLLGDLLRRIKNGHLQKKII